MGIGLIMSGCLGPLGGLLSPEFGAEHWVPSMARDDLLRPRAVFTALVW